MKLALIPAFLLVLHGCAKDNYTVIPNSPGNEQRMSSDLKTCKILVLTEYSKSQTHTGLVAGAVMGGAIGGMIGGALDASNGPSQAMKPRDIDPAIEQCMRRHGYNGTSEN